jgi:hypothetical protein
VHTQLTTHHPPLHPTSHPARPPPKFRIPVATSTVRPIAPRPYLPTYLPTAHAPTYLPNPHL